MKDIFAEITACLQGNGRIILATIVSSSGSSPLPSGSMMLINSSGQENIGSVGGGLLEALVVEEARKYFEGTKAPKIAGFDLDDDVSNEGMICGGNVDVLFEPLVPGNLDVFNRIRDLRNNGSDCVLLRTMGESKDLNRVILASREEELPPPYADIGKLEPRLLDVVRRNFGGEEVRRLKTPRGEVIVQPIKGEQDLVIFGGGHVSKYLAQIASVAGFSTTVIDDREEFADPSRFPGARRVLASDFGQAFEKVEVSQSTYVVIVTRGHSSDEAVLERAVHTPAKYIGMIGSRKKVIACFENITKRGIPLADLRRVHAPIGLDIGAISAEEIAVSIVAELIRVRRGFIEPSVPISTHLSDWRQKKSAEQAPLRRSP